MQTLLRQSSSTKQGSPALQPWQLPPQSSAVSLPFCTPSLHDGGWQVAGVPEQTPVVQSPPIRHSSPGTQRLHRPPPQSTSVSLPSFCPLPQASGTQKPS